MAILYELENEDADHIDRWLNFVIASKTKQLILDLDPYYPKVAPYNFPFKLFNATNSLQLQALKLTSVSLKLPANFMGFRNLQKLKLDCTDISDDDMQTLVSNCNALNFLDMKDQLELLRHILINSVMLNAMKIDPRPVVAVPHGTVMLYTEGLNCLNGYRVAMEYLSKSDHRNVLDVHEILLEDVQKREIHAIMKDRWIQEPKAMLSYF
uniref:At1g61320/AtMIF1 LRR domain-containing protein n=1 Tax=Oryza glumipatula TaxID=40148 RepID=A0A0E0AG06_9ORYZ